VPPEDKTLGDGLFIPSGTNVGVSTLAVYHSKTMYGLDADIYRPERWPEAKGKKLQAMDRDMELVIGGGQVYVSRRDDCVSGIEQGDC
jgi:hypothetical protein